jgi:hypothetical protein
MTVAGQTPASLMNTEQPKRAPEHIIGIGLLAQLVAAGYEVVPARDEQAGVVGWRAVPGFGDKYEVSSSGQLRRADTLALRSPTRSGDGYLKVDLWHQNSRRQVLLHRLVAEAFVPRPEGADEVNHLDGNKHNNAAGNLEWTDRRGNVDHFQYQLGKTVRPVLAISPDGSDTYYPSIEAAGRDGFNAKLISHVLNGHKKTHAGKRWVYTAFRSPASPPAVAAGGVTEEMVERAMSAFIASVREQDPEWTDEFDEEVNLISPTGDGFAPYFPIRAALSAALAVGDEGMRSDDLVTAVWELLQTVHQPTPKAGSDYWHVTAGKHVEFGKLITKLHSLLTDAGHAALKDTTHE